MKYLVKMDDGSDMLIKIKSVYVLEICSCIEYPQAIETQEGNPVMFVTYSRWRNVDSFCTI